MPRWHCLCFVGFLAGAFQVVAVTSKFMTSSTSTPKAGLHPALGILLGRSQEPPAVPVPPQQPGKTHMCAADPLQQQTGHLCLTVELGLREPQLMFCLRNRTGCSGQHTARTPLLPLLGRGNTHLLHHHPPSALSVLLAP